MSAPIRTGVPPIVEHSEDMALTLPGREPSSAVAPATYEPRHLIAQILNLAERGMPIADLKVLSEMERDISARQAVQDFNEALAAFKRECPAIRKNRTTDVATRKGGGFDLHWADLPAIQNVVDPILAKRGLSYSWDSEADDKGKLKTMCTLRHINGHSVSSSFSLPVENAAAMSLQQKFGSAMTFAQRRTLANVLGIVIEDDHPDTKHADPTTISEDQATTINDMLDEIGGSVRPRFLKHYEIERVEQLRAVDYQAAVVTLEETKAARAAKGRS